jgi:hypothetical protein
VAGQTHGATLDNLSGVVRDGTVIGDGRPTLDECWKGDPAQTITMTGRNIGDLLNAAGVSWGWFQGGFRASGTDHAGKAVCAAAHLSLAGASVPDYGPHQKPFQFGADARRAAQKTGVTVPASHNGDRNWSDALPSRAGCRHRHKRIGPSYRRIRNPQRRVRRARHRAKAAGGAKTLGQVAKATHLV